MIISGKEASKFCEKVSKINPIGVDIPPKKIFKYPENIEYVLLDGNKRGFYINGKFYDLREKLKEIKPINGYWILDPGLYYVVFYKVKIPKDTVAFAYPRSSLNRLGIIKSQTAVFDPGYEGEFQQLFYFVKRAKINVDEGWVQLVFFKLRKEVEEYKGYWNKESYD